MSPIKVPELTQSQLSFLKEKLREINILSDDFWECYRTGAFEVKEKYIIQELSKYKNCLSKFTLISSFRFPFHYKIDKNNSFFKNIQEYCISIMVDKKAFVILIHFGDSLISNIFYSDFNNIMECSNYQLRYNPIAKELIVKIKKELSSKKITVSGNIKRRISSESSVNTFAVSVLWKNYIKKDPHFSVEEIVKMIQKEIHLAEATIIQRGKTSPFKEVRQQANKIAWKVRKNRNAQKIKNRLSSKEMLELKKELQKSSILPNDFWNAFIKGKCPTNYINNISYHIEKYAILLKNLGYTHTLYLYNYIINLISIKDNFYISIHARQGKTHLLGCIEYNPFRFYPKKKLIYIEKRMNNHLTAFYIIHKIRREIIRKGFSIKIEPRRGTASTLPFIGSINRILVSVLWDKMIRSVASNDVIHFENELIAQKISHKLNKFEVNIEKDINSISVASYGTESSNKKVRKSAMYAENFLKSELHNLEQYWNELIKKDKGKIENTETLKKRMEFLSEKLDLSPIYISGVCRYSKIITIKQEAIKIYKILLLEYNEIEEKYLKLRKQYPKKNEVEIVKKLSKEMNLSPSYIARLGAESKNLKIKQAMNKASGIILSKIKPIEYKKLNI